MDNIFIRPLLAADGTPKRVPDPNSAVPRAVLPAEGAHRPRTSYWLRCLMHGDVEQPSPAPPPAAPAAAEDLPAPSRKSKS